MTTSGIYQIRNISNGKIYIGSAINIAARIRSHINDLNKNKHRNSRLQNSWRKHGQEFFELKTILVCGKSNLLMYEQICIDGLNPEYNICRIAGSQLNHRWSEESKIKMLGNKNGIGNKGRSGQKLSEKERLFLSDRMRGNKFAKGVKKSETELIATSKRMVGNKYRHGIKHSEERKQKQREFMIGNTFALGFRFPEETKTKFSVMRKGRSTSLKGRPWSEARRNSQRNRK